MKPDFPLTDVTGCCTSQLSYVSSTTVLDDFSVSFFFRVDTSIRVTVLPFLKIWFILPSRSKLVYKCFRGIEEEEEVDEEGDVTDVKVEEEPAFEVRFGGEVPPLLPVAPPLLKSPPESR